MPCQSRTAQPQSGAALSVHCATVHAPHPSLAQRKRTDDDDSPPWLYPTGHSDARRPDRERNRAVGVRTRRAPPPKGRTHSVSHCARPRSATRRCSLAVAAKRKLGGNQAPLQRVVGAFVHKRREDGSQALTTLHTTPLPSPHTELSQSRARAHSLSLSRSVHESRELESSCSHGGSPASPAAAGHVHRLIRCGVLRVQDGRARPGISGGDRLRLQQGGRLLLHQAGRAVLRQRQQGGRLLLHLQQLLPDAERHGRHLRLQRRRHPHRQRPQLRHLQVRLRTQQRRHRRDRRWHRRWHGRWHRHRRRDRRWHWSRHGHGRRDGDQHRSRRWHRHRYQRGDHDPREHPEPTVRRHGRVRPVRSRQHRLQRRPRAARRRAARGRRPCPRRRRRTSPPLGGARCHLGWRGKQTRVAGGIPPRRWRRRQRGCGRCLARVRALSGLCVLLLGLDRSEAVSVVVVRGYCYSTDLSLPLLVLVVAAMCDALYW